MAAEASSNSTNIAVGDTGKGSPTGPDLAAANAETWWLDEMLSVIGIRSADRGVVCACTAYPLDHIGAPDSPARVGAAFRIASQRGQIRLIGYHPARRRSRQGGVHGVWQGVA